MDREEVEHILKSRIQGDLSLGKRLGKGGMAEVYEVFGLACEAVLKVVSVDYVLSRLAVSAATYGRYYDQIVKYLRQEIVFLNQMKDCEYITRLISAYEICTEEADQVDLFLIFEEKYQCLDDYIRTQNLTEGLIIQIAGDILKALEALEEKKILHRDIKPGNIFIKWMEGTPRFVLGDFGLAREWADQFGQVTPHGTPAFGAPEVLSKKKLVGFNSDIYSLGASLFYIMTQGASPMLYFRQNEKPRLLQGSPELQYIILKAIEYNPEHRYQRAADMRKALEELPSANNIKQIIFNGYVYAAKKALMERRMPLAAKHAAEGFEKFRKAGRRTPNKEELACFRILIYIKMSSDTQYHKLKKGEVEMLTEIAEADDAVAQYLYGMYLYDKGKEAEGLSYMKKSADNGSEIGGYTYGRMLCQGYRSVPGDLQKGIVYLEGAAKRGYIPAIRYLKRIREKSPAQYFPSGEMAQLLKIEITNYEREKLMYVIPFL